jgi:rare lipoprotein A
MRTRYSFFGALLAMFAMIAATTVFAIESKPKPDNTPTISMTGYATYYTVKSCQSEGTSGVYTASGERFDENALTCAMRDRHWGRTFKVTNTENGKTCIVRLNDYGPGHGPTSKGVVIDLTPGVFKALGVLSGRGKISVKVESANSPTPSDFDNADKPFDTLAAPVAAAGKNRRQRSSNQTPIPIDPF